MNLSRYEKETVINFNDEEKKAIVYTCNSKLIEKLISYCDKHKDKFKLICQDKISATFEIDKKLISIRQPRIYTDEQKEKLRENLKKNKKLD